MSETIYYGDHFLGQLLYVISINQTFVGIRYETTQGRAQSIHVMLRDAAAAAAAGSDCNMSQVVISDGRCNPSEIDIVTT